MRVFVSGSGGLVGRAVCEYCQSIGDTVLPYDHHRLDITDRIGVIETIVKERPDVVINCAAWTDVDGCERDHSRAYAVNSEGPENLARASRRCEARFIFISTDYVFDGLKSGFYTQRDHPNPLSVYAASKLEGERRAWTEYARTIIVRTGYVFGPGGTNFLSTIVPRVRAGETLSAIGDAYGTPTYSHHLARRLRELADVDLPAIFHVVNEGRGVSFEEFAREATAIAGCAGVHIKTVSMEDLKRPAPRPLNSRLRCLFSEAIGLAPMPEWRAGLREFLLGGEEGNQEWASADGVVR